MSGVIIKKYVSHVIFEKNEMGVYPDGRYAPRYPMECFYEFEICHIQTCQMCYIETCYNGTQLHFQTDISLQNSEEYSRGRALPLSTTSSIFWTNSEQCFATLRMTPSLWHVRRWPFRVISRGRQGRPQLSSARGCVNQPQRDDKLHGNSRTRKDNRRMT